MVKHPKKKGNLGESRVYKWLRATGIDKTATRNTSSGSGIIKSDVVNSLGLNIEVKTVKKLNLKKAFEQSERDAFKSHTIPCVFTHFDNMSQDTWLVTLHSEDWKDLWLKAREPKTVNPDRTLRWSLERLKQAVNQVLTLIK